HWSACRPTSCRTPTPPLLHVGPARSVKRIYIENGGNRTLDVIGVSAAEAKRPEAVSQGNPGSLCDSLALPSLWLESAPCPSVSGPVRPSRPLWSSAVPASRRSR